jgi:hypothetical protein
MAYRRITPKPAEALRERIRPILRFFARCRQGLSDRHIERDSELVKSHDAVHALSVTAHYDSIQRGVGKKRQDNPELRGTDGTPDRGSGRRAGREPKNDRARTFSWKVPQARLEDRPHAALASRDATRLSRQTLST